MNHQPGAGLRGLALVSGVLSAGLLLTYAALPAALAAAVGAQPTFADLVAGGCAAAALLAWGWLATGVVACTVTDLRCAPAPGWWVPRTAGLLVAITLGAGAVHPGPASGETHPATGTSSSPRAALAEMLDGLRVPDRTLGAPLAAPQSALLGASLAEPLSARRTWMVRRGDTLWALAERQLPREGREAGAIDQQWRRIYRANRAEVGPDPDLIQPGTPLSLPPVPRGGPR